jgi:hypothetical protein
VLGQVGCLAHGDHHQHLPQVVAVVQGEEAGGEAKLLDYLLELSKELERLVTPQKEPPVPAPEGGA